MRLDGGRESGNVEDRRGQPGGPVMVGGGLGMIVLVVIVIALGGDPRALLQNMARQQPPGPMAPEDGAPMPVNEHEEELKKFVSIVLADTEDVWTDVFANEIRSQRPYPPPKLVLFTGQVNSACGSASAASGPFYCPEDEKVYIDLAFYDEMKSRFGAPGDFAQAYVIAHEIGHHVQNQLGILQKVHALRGRVSDEEYNRASVRLELQADYLAGMWAHHAQKMRDILEPGDIDEALNAANAIGDDTLQRQSSGHVVPDSFTHGTSAQRARWFRKGFQSGRLRDGDTFEVDYDDL
ncbi:MAG TPA: neutral zinc metallopeptidase [Planctomycetaceae bacterium]|nr:neutral zinc metallopeptidase [Planctomycetaceae bacterium]